MTMLKCRGVDKDTAEAISHMIRRLSELERSSADLTSWKVEADQLLRGHDVDFRTHLSKSSTGSQS
jgi:hypothetical protein